MTIKQKRSLILTIKQLRSQLQQSQRRIKDRTSQARRFAAKCRALDAEILELEAENKHLHELLKELTAERKKQNANLRSGKEG